jgi:hypothetical protein
MNYTNLAKVINGTSTISPKVIYGPSVYVPRGYFAYIYVEGSDGTLKGLCCQDAAKMNYIHVEWGRFNLGMSRSSCKIQPLSTMVHVHFESQVELRKDFYKESDENNNGKSIKISLMTKVFRSSPAQKGLNHEGKHKSMHLSCNQIRTFFLYDFLTTIMRRYPGFCQAH